ncbi:hypothetical protein IRT38_00185 (plasmid) [Acinetobacter sp. SK-43]|uniref:hypothetical protein n=1 Tax=Pseudomonadota TaxID=1224 RepID=UPI0012C2CEF8|nr:MULTISPECIES: hypothetical protein [Pseudomonadota]MBF4453831.1 hypothetical protein [Acinetobacter sp. SK-43]MPS92769.1 hypothetical protein [Comamonas sp.]
MDKLSLLKRNGIFLKFIKVEMRDYVMCATAVYSNPIAIKFIPPQHLDDEILEHVIHAGEKYVDLIPKEFLSDYHFHLIRELYPYAQILSNEPIRLNSNGLKALEQVYDIIGYPQFKKFA